MIYGIGCDITKVSRFEKWVNNPEMLERFFNREEFSDKKNPKLLCEHYAARFAAKEAFSKALGTGLAFDLRGVYVVKNEDGKPSLNFSREVSELLYKRCGKNSVFLSLSHEKEYALASVVIEKL
ncbi:MAG: holo-ACP synthase [Treponema sp.]|nr:holo-ACP synthase [Treponema sp.]